MSSKTTFTILGAFVAIWAVFGFMDVGNFSYTGYTTDFDNNVSNGRGRGPGRSGRHGGRRQDPEH